MEFPEIYSASGLIELIQQIGFLPLLDSGIVGFSAEEIVDEDCGYVALPEGGWEWPLWKWKGEIVTASTRKQDSSVKNGGRISAITEEVNIRILPTVR